MVRGPAGMGIAPALVVLAPTILTGVTTAISALLGRRGGKQKIAATQVVESAEPLMVDNLEAYQAGGHTLTEQAEAINNFYSLWSYISTNCGDPALGDAGVRCISERQQGGKYDYFKRYLDPIKNDTSVVADPELEVKTVMDPTTGQPVEVVMARNGLTNQYGVDGGMQIAGFQFTNTQVLIGLGLAGLLLGVMTSGGRKGK